MKNENPTNTPLTPSPQPVTVASPVSVVAPPPTTTNAGINQTPIVPVKVVSGKKGFWAWFINVFSGGAIQRLEIDTQTAQAYATQKGLTYEANTESIPTGPDGIGSVLLASYGLTVFHHHLHGLIQGRMYDSLIWFIKKRLQPQGFGFNNQDNTVTQMTTVQAGRITIDKALPSVIVVSNQQGLSQSNNELFSRFTGAQTVRLEGGFSNYFDVYTTSSDGVSAFQTLPPNLMELLIQSYQDAAIEFVGNSIYLLTESNVNRGSFGKTKPSVVAADLDTQQARLLQLASFFALTEGASLQALAPQDIITDKPIPTIQL